MSDIKTFDPLDWLRKEQAGLDRSIDNMSGSNHPEIIHGLKVITAERDRYKSAADDIERLRGALANFRGDDKSIWSLHSMANQIEKWKTRAEMAEAEIERLRAEAAKFPVQLSEVVERSTDDMNYWKDRAEKAEAEHKRLHDAASELLEVANLRGDNDLPHPADDPKLWTGRMQDAWHGIAEALAETEPEPKRGCGTCRFKLGDGKCHNCIRECIQERLEYINWQPKEGA